MTSKAFQPYVLGGVQLRNRIVRSATVDPFGNLDGTVSQTQIDYYAALARNQVGLIITGMASISASAASSLVQNGCYDDRFLPGHRALTDAVHAQGGAVVCQISHTGNRSMGPDRFGPSGIDTPGCTGPSRPMTAEDIAAVFADFAATALRVKQAGYDGVQLHGAHGYLLSQFLNPMANQRTDKYGGSVENRFRIVEEVILAVRAAVGPTYPILIKLNSNVEEHDEAFLDDLIWICRRCKELGLCAVELSGFDFTPRGKRGERTYYLERAAAVRKAADIPVILVGGIRSIKDMDTVIDAGVDMVSLSRPFICEPDLLPRLLAGQEEARCISCSQCFLPLRGKGKPGVWCVLNPADQT